MIATPFGLSIIHRIDVGSPDVRIDLPANTVSNLLIAVQNAYNAITGNR